MKITILRRPAATHYTTRFGRLVVPRRKSKQPSLYPSATGGHVSVQLSRRHAADGLREWRANP